MRTPVGETQRNVVAEVRGSSPTEPKAKGAHTILLYVVSHIGLLLPKIIKSLGDLKLLLYSHKIR